MIKKVKEFMSGAGVLVIFLVYFMFPVGFLYWLWMAIQLGSFWMFLLGFLPTLLIAAPVGLWSLFFGMPNWVATMFG